MKTHGDVLSQWLEILTYVQTTTNLTGFSTSFFIGVQWEGDIIDIHFKTTLITKSWVIYNELN